MPLVPSNYNPPFLFKNAYVSTIYSGVFRKIEGLSQQRERIQLPDGDFIDLDWSYTDKTTKNLVIVLHGLEGSSKRAYVQGAAKNSTIHGFDVCAINYRGCSGVPNKLYRSYHSGATEDLELVIQHILSFNKYEKLFLHGFSLGGNLLLKYLGEERKIPIEIKGAVAISVPCQLADSLQQLLKFKNTLYAKRFKKNLIEKLRLKQKIFPGRISNTEINQIKTLKDFDDIYTSKAHGFKDAMDYYAKCSCLQFLPNIKVPVLLLNAQNDSFLGKECFPIHIARKSALIHLEMPTNGGHVGFHGSNNITYAEKRTMEFITDLK